MKVAAIQAAPIFLDTKTTTEKVLQLMTEAASQGAKLCAFPETFLSGYPVWLFWTDPTNLTSGELYKKHEKAYAAYVKASVQQDGPELAVISEQARKLNLFTYLGVILRSSSGNSVYCAMVAIHPERGIVSIQRKMMPTWGERMVWAIGDGHGLRVHDWGEFRVGALNCWENLMPLARTSLYAQGETLHIAAWPGAPEDMKITPFIAEESRSYVISVVGVYKNDDIPDSFVFKKEMEESDSWQESFTGGTTIVGPDAQVIAGPVTNEETIIYADIDPERVREARWQFDATGHYNRPDVFKLSIDRRRLETAEFSTDFDTDFLCEENKT